MTVGQAVVWASQNIDPKYTNPELTTSEPYVMGSHATCSGAWVSGPEDIAPDEYFWGYNRMTTVDGLFGAGDTVGGSAHKFSSGSFTEGLGFGGQNSPTYYTNTEEWTAKTETVTAKTLTTG